MTTIDSTDIFDRYCEQKGITLTAQQLVAAKKLLNLPLGNEKSFLIETLYNFELWLKE